jgi:hypothetical protein
VTDNPWADNPAAITAQELLELAVDALANKPEPDATYARDRQHPEDAYSDAWAALQIVTGLRNAEWQANRRAGQTSPGV